MSLFGGSWNAENSWLGFGIFILMLIWSMAFDTQMFQMLALSILILKVQRTSMSLKSRLWASEDTAWDHGSWSEFEYGHWSLVHPCFKFWLIILYLKVQRTSISFKSSYGIWNLDLDLDLDMVTGLWYTNGPNFALISWFWKRKEHPCPLSPHLELLRMLGDPDWGLSSWSWLGWVKEPCLDLSWSFHFTQISCSGSGISSECSDKLCQDGGGGVGWDVQLKIRISSS